MAGDDRKITDTQYCKWDATFEQYVYSRDFVAKVVEDCRTEEGFEKVIGWAPKPVPP